MNLTGPGNGADDLGNDLGNGTNGEQPPPVLQMSAVVKEHRDGSAVVRALDQVDLQVFAGEVVAITGRSGSGKSTLLNVAGGLDTLTAGEIVVEGRAIVGMSRSELAAMRRTSVGFVFQNLNLIPSLDATENVSLPMEFDGLAPAKARQAATEALDRVGIGDLATRFPDELSGGERQRVAIARAVAGPRRLILADEPTGALDEQTGRAIMVLLRSLASDGAAVVVVTHEAELAGHADRVVRLKDGRVEMVVERPRTPPTPVDLLR